MRWQRLLCAVASLSPTVIAVFTDDAYHLDYHHALLGIPKKHTTFFHRPQLSSDASLIYTISDKAVLGAIRPKDGSLVWRQALAGQPTETEFDAYFAGGRDGAVFSGHNGTLAGWDALDGRLLWESQLPEGYCVKGLQAVPSSTDGSSVGQDVILLIGPKEGNVALSIQRVGGAGSGTKWEYKDISITSDSIVSIATSPKHAYYISKQSGILAGGKVKVLVFDILSGALTNQYNVALETEALGDAGTYSTGSCSQTPFLVSSEKPFKTLKINVLGNTKVSTINLENQGDDIEDLAIHTACGNIASAHFLVHIKTKSKQWAEVYHINPKGGDATKAYSFPATTGPSTFAATSVGDTNYFARITNSEIVIYSSESSAELGHWSRTTSPDSLVSQISYAVIEVSARGKSGLAIRAALAAEHGELSLIRNGDHQWSRPEMLAYIKEAVWSEDFDSTLSTQDIEAEAAANPVSAYLHRLTRHVQELSALPQYLVDLPQSILQPSEDASSSVRQKLVGGKLILAVTSRHELYAIDAAHAGKVRWRFDLSRHLSPSDKVVHLSVSEERLTIFGSNGSIIVIDVTKGGLIEDVKGSKSFEKIVELPGSPASTIVKVGIDGVPQVFSDLAPAIPEEGNTVVTINDKGEALGWSIGTSVQKTWTVRPRGGAKFVNAAFRPSHDPIASIGKVLGDRSVLYKFITPNLALLTALSSTTLTMYLINAVTGAVLHTSSHEGVLANLPVPTILSEHWFAYSFTAQDPATSGLTTQIVISELYESEVPNDRGLLSSKTNYSSFSADAAATPFIISQAYTIVAPISNLTVTQTLQGITSRQIVAIAPDLNAVVGISRDELDARRPTDRDVTSAEMEEGLHKYSSILDLNTKYFLSHAREVIGLQGLMTTPTLLESTSMVFAFGHDVFGTQVSPSNTFDILGKGFKRVQLILTVVALYAGVLFLRPLVRRKTVETRFL